MTMSKEVADGFRQVAADQIAQDIEIASKYPKKTDLATVATSGSYNDLTDKPTSGGSTTVEVATYTITETATTAQSYSLGTDVAYVMVFVNNVLGVDGETYGITGGTTLQFSDVLPVGTQIIVVKFKSVGSVIPTPSYSIDSALSDTSTNAVQNRVVKTAIESKADEATVNALISETVTPLQTSIDTAYAKYVAEIG